MNKKGWVITGVAGILILSLGVPIYAIMGKIQGKQVMLASEIEKYRISMVSRQFTPERGILSNDLELLRSEGLKALGENRDQIHAIVQLFSIPSSTEKEILAKQGIRLLEYIPENAWLASIPAGNPAGILANPKVRWAGALLATDKTDPEIPIEQATWAYEATTNQVALYVKMHMDIPPDLGDPLLSFFGEVKSFAHTANVFVLWTTKDKIEQIQSLDQVSWVEPAEPKWEPINLLTRQWIDSDNLDSAAYSNADGSNVDVLIYDGGWVRNTHVKLTSARVTRRDTNCTVSSHSTHVACTVAGLTTGDSSATGHANDVHAILSDCMSTSTGVFFYTDPGELESDLVYAKSSWVPSGGDGDGAELLNASVGTNSSVNWICAYEGNYGPTSIILDNVVRGDATSGNKFIAVWANGNERQVSTCGSTYHTTAPPSCAKNPIQVGATYNNSDSMTTFSSWGPTDDGRIKPIVSAPGDGSSGIYSCSSSSDTAYGYMGGTSMASPAVAGVVAQLIEYSRAQGSSTSSGEFWPSTAKALLMHSAVDLGNTGPDYQYGYGRVDADAAADLITNDANGPDFRQDSVSAMGEIDTYQITLSGASQLKVTLAWDDEASTMQSIKKLVNDLDLEVISPSSVTYYPYILNPSSPSSAATTGTDHLNNQEQTVISSPANGIWTIRVKATALPSGSQDYSIIFPGAYNTSPTQTAGATPTRTPTPDSSYCSEYITNGGIESSTTGWTVSGSAARSTTLYHSGASSMRAGGTSNGSFYQTVIVPSDMHYGTISFWYRMDTSETGPYPYDFFDVEIRDSSNNTLTTLLSTDDRGINGSWIQSNLVIDSGYAGLTIRLFFSADVDSSVNSYWYVDDVSVNLCTLPPTPSGPTNTPTRTPTVTRTPTPTSTFTQAPPTNTPTRTSTPTITRTPTVTPTFTITPTVTPTSACSDIFTENFESKSDWDTGGNIWTETDDSDSDVGGYGGSGALQGRIRDNKACRINVSTLGYDSVTISLSVSATNGMDTNDYTYFEVSTSGSGGPYTVLFSQVDGFDWTDAGPYDVSNLTGNACNDNADFWIQCRTTADQPAQNNEYSYFDDIVVNACLISETPTPTITPTFTAVPTHTPTLVPTNTPTLIPTGTPTRTPTPTFTAVPTSTPTLVPTNTPTQIPTGTPTLVPTNTPTFTPTDTPTEVPTHTPTSIPTGTPTQVPTQTSTAEPTETPVQPTSTPLPVPATSPTGIVLMLVLIGVLFSLNLLRTK